MTIFLNVYFGLGSILLFFSLLVIGFCIAEWVSNRKKFLGNAYTKPTAKELAQDAYWARMSFLLIPASILWPAVLVFIGPVAGVYYGYKFITLSKKDMEGSS